MVANISSMFSGRSIKPWHNQGTVVDGLLSSEEAIKTAGLSWKVTPKEMFISSCSATKGLIKVDSNRAIVREDTETVLGVVGNRYLPIQNSEAFNFFDNVVGNKDAFYDTAGALGQGERIWLLAKLPGDIQVAGKDTVEKYLLLVNSHDGSTALQMMFTPVRVVCQNTLNMALNKKIGHGISIRHTKNAQHKIQEAQRALGMAVTYYNNFETTANQMATARFSDAQMTNLINKLFPAPKVRKNKEELGEVDSTVTSRSKEQLMTLWNSGTGIAPFRGTAWGAFNAVTEYADYYRNIRAGDNDVGNAQLASIWLGSAANLKQEAFNQIQILVG